MFNLYKIQLKAKCKELYEENLKLKEQLEKCNCDKNINENGTEAQKENNNIKLEIVDKK